eukprot:s1579_g19.t2
MGSAITTIVFQPPQPSYSRDPNLIWLSTSEHEVIPAFFIDRDAKFTLLFSHGNAEAGCEGTGSIGSRESWAGLGDDHPDVNVFAYDYTGYGMSSGKPSEQALYADIEAAFKYLRDIVGTPWSEIVVYGRSIGTAVRAIVLQSPLLSIYRVAFSSSFTLPGDMFPNVDRIGQDEIIPSSHAEDLVRNCREGIAYPPYLVENGGHNNLELIARQPFYDNFTKFLQWLEKSEISEELHQHSESVGHDRDCRHDPTMAEADGQDDALGAAAQGHSEGSALAKTSRPQPACATDSD